MTFDVTRFVTCFSFVNKNFLGGLICFAMFAHAFCLFIDVALLGKGVWRAFVFWNNDKAWDKGRVWAPMEFPFLTLLVYIGTDFVS